MRYLGRNSCPRYYQRELKNQFPFLFLSGSIPDQPPDIAIFGLPRSGNEYFCCNRFPNYLLVLKRKLIPTYHEQ